MKNKANRFLLLWLLLCTAVPMLAQTYKNISVEQGLNNRRVFRIIRDSVGYVWFLNSEGIDRWNGRTVKHYKMSEPENPFRITSYTGWLFTGVQGEPLVVGSKGRVFRYSGMKDGYEMIFRTPGENVNISYCYLDSSQNIWLCDHYNLTLYNLRTKRVFRTPNPLSGNINTMVQVDKELFMVATDLGLYYIRKLGDELKVTTLNLMERIASPVSALYYHSSTRSLYVGTIERGVFEYNFGLQRLTHVCKHLSETKITRIIPLNADELLIGSEGRGIHKLVRQTGETSPYIVADYNHRNAMTGNNIADIYVDNEQRIWLADYPVGITVIDNRFRNYSWLRHSPGNDQSLVNNHVHCVMQDSEGDLWFGTSNGISLYRPSSGRWHSFLNTPSEEVAQGKRTHIFVTLCEVVPGVVCAGSYSSGIYRIDKHTLTARYYSPFLWKNNPTLHPDRYVRELLKDSHGRIWAGGVNGLKECNPANHRVREYAGLREVTALAEKDSIHLWVGTATGLFLLNRDNERLRPVRLTVEGNYINTLYQAPNGLLYIGTDGVGLLVYDHTTGHFTTYHKDNSALVTNHIYSILPEREGYILMGTENGLTRFSVADSTFTNWTKEQGLMSACLNGADAVSMSDGGCVFGTPEGVVIFPPHFRFPYDHYAPMAFTELRIFDRTVHPGEPGSPLKQYLNKTDQLTLEYDQNSFSFCISDINYDSPGNLFYRWYLDGYSSNWNHLQDDELLRVFNLPPGNYTLHVEAFSKAEPYLCKERRSMQIRILSPWWLTPWAIVLYVTIPLLLVVGAFVLINLRKEKRALAQKNRFFISTAHNVRTPLALITAPLEELAANVSLDERATGWLDTALRNLNALQQLATNLINFEQAEHTLTRLHIAEYELHSYLDGLCNNFSHFASLRGITFTFESDFRSLSVWFDKEKMDSIMLNILSNAIKYTPDGGSITLKATAHKEAWSITLTDTGIGIPERDLKRLFHLYFRGSNAVNSKVTGSGIGLPLVRRLVRLHHGRIEVQSVEQQGTVVRIEIPCNRKRFGRYIEVEPVSTVAEVPRNLSAADRLFTPGGAEGTDGPRARVLIAEDNDELRAYLAHSLSDKYDIRTCVNGKEALQAIPTFRPDLILTDIMMPQMRGDELCVAVKNNIETSHIAVILLTALTHERDVLNGLRIGADEYIPKPFNISILKASIANLLYNRGLLRRSYAGLEFPTVLTDKSSVSADGLPPVGNELDVRFLTSVRQHVEEHLADPDFTVDTLCADIGMSRTAFYSKLKALTGQAPADFVRALRLQHALRLLVEEHLSVVEVADRTGFCDSKYFREVFKKHFGLSPMQYVKEKQKKSSR